MKINIYYQLHHIFAKLFNDNNVFCGSSSEETQESYLGFIAYALSICDFILNLSLFTLFIYKMKNKDSMEGIEIDDDGFEFPDKFPQNDGRKAIWNVMIKHSLLFGIAILMNQTWYISSIINALILSDTNYPLILIRSYTSRAIENAMNIVILWLVLKGNNNRYIYLCKCCHQCILRFCKERGSKYYS